MHGTHFLIYQSANRTRLQLCFARRHGKMYEVIPFEALRMVDSRSSTVHAWADEGLRRESGISSEIARKQSQQCCVGVETLALVPSGYRYLTFFIIQII